MHNLYDLLSKYKLEKALEFENNDRQYLAVKKLEKNIDDKGLYLALIITNSLICYQLSGKAENYWEEFGLYFSTKKITKESLLIDLSDFIKNSKNNKRFVDNKIKRLKKIEPFLKSFYLKQEYYYKNMAELNTCLAKSMNQDLDAKTIVFAIKMFSYGSRNIYDFVEFPFSIFIPIDSRLTKIFEKYKGDYRDIKKFYLDLSKKLNIAPLHLDSIVWNLYDDLIKYEN